MRTRSGIKGDEVQHISLIDGDTCSEEDERAETATLTLTVAEARRLAAGLLGFIYDTHHPVEPGFYDFAASRGLDAFKPKWDAIARALAVIEEKGDGDHA